MKGTLIHRTTTNNTHTRMTNNILILVITSLVESMKAPLGRSLIVDNETSTMLTIATVPGGIQHLKSRWKSKSKPKQSGKQASDMRCYIISDATLDAPYFGGSDTGVMSLKIDESVTYESAQQARLIASIACAVSTGNSDTDTRSNTNAPKHEYCNANTNSDLTNMININGGVKTVNDQKFIAKPFLGHLYSQDTCIITSNEKIN